MSTLEVITICGFGAVILQLVSLLRVLESRRFDGDSGFADEVMQKLSAIEDRLSEVEGHTSRLAEPLYDQDKFEREHLIGKYAEPY